MKMIIVPNNYKHLSQNEKNLLQSIFSLDNEIDCQYNTKIARKLEKKHLITLQRPPIGFVDNWPLYAKINQIYKSKLDRLISKDNFN